MKYLDVLLRYVLQTFGCKISTAAWNYRFLKLLWLSFFMFFCQHPFKQQLLTVLILSSSVQTTKRPKNPENYFKHHKLATDFLIHEGFTNSFSNPFRRLQENLNLMASCIYANRFTRSCRQME